MGYTLLAKNPKMSKTRKKYREKTDFFVIFRFFKGPKRPLIGRIGFWCKNQKWSAQRTLSIVLFIFRIRALWNLTPPRGGPKFRKKNFFFGFLKTPPDAQQDALLGFLIPPIFTKMGQTSYSLHMTHQDVPFFNGKNLRYIRV